MGKSTMLEHNIPFYYSWRITFTLAIKLSLISDDLPELSLAQVSHLFFSFKLLQLTIYPLLSRGGKALHQRQNFKTKTKQY